MTTCRSKSPHTLARISGIDISSRTRTLPCRAPHLRRQWKAQTLALFSEDPPRERNRAASGNCNLRFSNSCNSDSVDGATPFRRFASPTQAARPHSTQNKQATFMAAGTAGCSWSLSSASLLGSLARNKLSVKACNASTGFCGHFRRRPKCCK